ncbi:MAG TPA: branched-chain amino acid ABC transporter substrate-binding protein, partial [Anaerolineae bacterium]|nr:branched-chain amino acid ABC transporter substrate-binding protein [Anaerolineae bacterium]
MKRFSLLIALLLIVLVAATACGGGGAKNDSGPIKIGGIFDFSGPTS